MSSALTSTTNMTAVRRNAYGLPDIALIGRAGAGKTTAALQLTTLGVLVGDALDPPVHYERRSFAAPLREVAVTLWGEDARNDRHLLQSLGVAAREIVADTWLDLFSNQFTAERKMEVVDHRPWPVVVDDCRFENEYFALKALGFVTVRILAHHTERVKRLQASGKFQSLEQLEHISETALDGVPCDYTLFNNGSSMDLYGDLVGTVILREARRS